MSGIPAQDSSALSPLDFAVGRVGAVGKVGAVGAVVAVGTVGGAQILVPAQSGAGSTVLPATAGAAGSAGSIDEQLANAKLGAGSSLYRALRWKHEPTARHCLRVALACASWAQRLAIDPEQRDALEFAALLHDVGKIGIPDAILTKPASLSAPEWALMRGHWLMGQEMLRGLCNHRQALDILSSTRCWYDGSRSDNGLRGDGLPLGARMLAIADAFDSLTNHQAYRSAKSHEEAFEELARNAGGQFDPTLVKMFRETQVALDPELPLMAANRWLRSVDPEAFESRWGLSQFATPAPLVAPLFQAKLLENMYDAVTFIDRHLRVIHWNHGAERLTGLAASTVFQGQWTPTLLGLRDEHGKPIADADCPVAFALRTGVHWLRRLSIVGRRGREIAVDAQLVPVVDELGVTQGLSLLMHDVSPEISLEERCQDLQVQASQDPLTQVGNRAEFDRVHRSWVAGYDGSRLPFCLIIADIDRFKSINDTFGHPAGDKVIQNFADTLRGLCRTGDLVARYGGEEFAVLCHNCDKSEAARRAEEMRAAFAAMKHEPLGGRRVTSSFGVTEIQAGDSPETMVRRADRALYEAKDGGRNRVETIGGGGDGIASEARVRHLRTRRQGNSLQIEQELVSQAPIEQTLEKLRGFIADHDAQIVEASANYVALRLGKRRLPTDRGAERSIMLLLDVKVARESTAAGPTGANDRTCIHVRIRPEKARERRRHEVSQAARQLLASFRSYLMVEPSSPPEETTVLGRARQIVQAWFDR